MNESEFLLEILRWRSCDLNMLLWLFESILRVNILMGRLLTTATQMPESVATAKRNTLITIIIIDWILTMPILPQICGMTFNSTPFKDFETKILENKLYRPNHSGSSLINRTKHMLKIIMHNSEKSSGNELGMNVTWTWMGNHFTITSNLSPVDVILFWPSPLYAKVVTWFI